MSNTSVPIELSSTPGIVDNSNATAITIDSNENVGIGTSSPYSAVTIIPSSNPTSVGTATQLSVGETTANSGYALKMGYFVDGGGYKSSIQSIAGSVGAVLVLNGDGGNVGIGTNSPSDTLVVAGTSVVTSGQAIFTVSSSTTSAGNEAEIKLIHAGNNTYEIKGGSDLIFSSDDGANERVRITTAGNVGIGTSSPNDILDIHKANSQLRLTDTDDSKFVQFSYSGGKLIVRNNSTTTSDNQFTILENGNFGIGTIDPKQKLTVAGRFNSDGNNDYYGAWLTGDTSTGGDSHVAVGAWYSTAAYLERRQGEGYTHLYEYNPAHHIVIQAGSGVDGRASSSAGNVGIGTTSPNAKLTVELASTDHTSIGNTVSIRGPTSTGLATGAHYDGSGAGATFVSIGYSSTQGGYRFYSANGSYGSISERMRIDTSGNLLVGTTSATPSNGIVLYKDASRGILRVATSVSAADAVAEFYNPNGKVGQIITNGSATSYQSLSDYRLKENVEYDWDATTRLKQLKPARFNFIADAATTVDGFLAHEVSSIVPEAIYGEKDEMDDEGNPKYQGIDQSKLVPLLVKTIQELEVRLSAAQETISQLDSRIQALEE